MDFENEIVKTGGLDQFGQPYAGNAERTLHTGLEFSGVARLFDGLDLAGNLTWSRNRFVKFTEFVQMESDDGVAVVGLSRDGNPIAGSPDWLSNLRLSYRRWGATVALDFKFVGKQFTDNSNDTWADGSSANGARVVDPYKMLGLTASYQLPPRTGLKGLSLGAEIHNLLNEKILLAGYGDDNFFPAAPRSFFLRVHYEH